MPGRTVSRRRVVGIIGGGIALAPAIASALTARASSSSSNDLNAPSAGEHRALLDPLRAGSKLGAWTVASVSPLQEGAITVTLESSEGHSFRLEILARDPSPLAPKPPMQTARFAVYVRNGGDGWAPTIEEQGLAAMALGAIIESNEGSQADAARGFLTHAERFATHRESLLPKYPSKRA